MGFKLSIWFRYLALNFPDVFASPVPQTYQEFQEILVVAHKDLIENGQVDKYLKDARLSVSTAPRYVLPPHFVALPSGATY